MLWVCFWGRLGKGLGPGITKHPCLTTRQKERLQSQLTAPPRAGGLGLTQPPTVGALPRSPCFREAWAGAGGQGSTAHTVNISPVLPALQ